MNWLDDYLKRLFLLLAGAVFLLILAILFLKPASWGQYGEYRGNAINDETSKLMAYGTNQSCKSCHEEVFELKQKSVHKRLSCEICHSVYSDHVKNDKKYKNAHVNKKEQQIENCLMCHQKVVGRDESFPVIDRLEHLTKLRVKPTHKCDQCHTVHAPLENIKRVKALRLLKETSTDE